MMVCGTEQSLDRSSILFRRESDFRRRIKSAYKAEQGSHTLQYSSTVQYCNSTVAYLHAQQATG